jgi:hypothetical protein
MQIKCLSVRQPWANLIATGRKTIEVRTWWPTVPTGSKLLIVSSLRPPIAPAGFAVAMATLYDVERLRKDHLAAACLDKMPDKPSFAWHLMDVVRLFDPFRVKGRLGIWTIEVEDRQLRGAWSDAWKRAPDSFGGKEEKKP